jgi:hypothetical protein
MTRSREPRRPAPILERACAGFMHLLHANRLTRAWPSRRFDRIEKWPSTRGPNRMHPLHVGRLSEPPIEAGRLWEPPIEAARLWSRRRTRGGGASRGPTRGGRASRARADPATSP